MRYSLLLSLFFLTFNLYAGKDIEIDVQHITTLNGLPANSVRCMHQDRKGFLWIGTINNGLCKYDGTDFHVIGAGSDEGPGLADSRIKSIQEDDYGYLWILTMSDQVSCYDPMHERFIDYSGVGRHDEHYGHVTFCKDGLWLWGSRQGCMYVKYNEGNFVSETYTVESNTLPSDHVTFLMIDSGVTWIGTDKGLCRHHDGKIERVVSGAHFVAGEVLGKEVIFISSEGDMWKVREDGLSHVNKIPGTGRGGSLITGTFAPDEVSCIVFTSSGAYSYFPVDNKIRQASAPYDLRNAEVKSDGKGNSIIYDKSGNLIYFDSKDLVAKRLELSIGAEEALWTTRYDFVRTSDDVVWISTHENGLFAYDIAEDCLHNFNIGIMRGGTASNILMCVLEDFSGNIWVGSEFSGIFKVNTISKGASYMHFNHKAGNEYSDMVRMIGTHDDDQVWICTRDGYIYIYDNCLKNVVCRVRYDANIYAVCRDMQSKLWVGTRGKGLFVDGHRYSYENGNPCSLSSDNIFDILEDKDGNMWIATFGGGLNLAIKEEYGSYSFRNFFNDTYSRRHIRALELDAEGYVWVGCSNGVMVFKPEQMKVDPSKYMSFNRSGNKLRSNECRSVACDSKGRMYIAETGVGFSICVPENYSELQFRHFGPEDGLVSGLVQGFVEDTEGRMWITTEYGISCFDPETENFSNFIFSSSMQGNVCMDNSTARLNDGRILVGTNAGLAIIDTDAVSVSKKGDTEVVLTSFDVHGQKVVSGDDAPIGTSISYAQKVRLKYDQNTFSLSFSTLDYTSGTMYSYILEGYDDEWSPPSEINEAIYRQIPYGEYRFQVRSINPMGQGHGMPTSIDIVVRPPFYKTSLAYFIYVLLILAILYAAWKIVSRMNFLRNEAAVEKRLTEYKVAFFTNVSHEFRTPLTLILHSLEKMRRNNELDENGRHAVKTMEAGTARLMRLINQLLEFRKIQSDKHVLRLEKTDVIAFCREIFENFKDAANAKRLDYRFVNSEQEHMMYLDQGDMDKVIYNLISNAIKYTPEGGRVTVSIKVSEENRKIYIEVRDNGIGIPEHKRKDLFMSFSSGEASESSMGIGLHLTKSLVDANKGEIIFEENLAGGGTIMTVILPDDPSVYKPEDFKETTSAVPVVKIPTISDRTLRNESLNRPIRPINPHKILVVEDEPEIRRLIVTELQGYFNVVEASDGTSALDFLRGDETIELVVCDVMMPGISGYEVTASIKADISTCHIPVILLTALNSDEKRLEGIQSGADAYITKPFSPDYVLTRILKLLEQRNRLREKFSNDLSLKTESICTNDMDREFMDRVDAILEKHLADPDFSMDDFASEMAMGRSSFYNKIHKVTGYSPNKYLRILRMKKAAELILTGKYTAAEVSYKVGIQDASYFSKSFREQFGISPKAYYKQATEGLVSSSSDPGQDSSSGD